jgi:hypothetical protein
MWSLCRATVLKLVYYLVERMLASLRLLTYPSVRVNQLENRGMYFLEMLRDRVSLNSVEIPQFLVNWYKTSDNLLCISNVSPIHLKYIYQIEKCFDSKAVEKHTSCFKRMFCTF